MSRKKRKYPLFFPLMLCMVLLLCACGEDDNYYYKEQEIIDFVQEHEEELRRQIEAVGEDEKIEEFEGIASISDRRDTYGIVYYEYIESGLMTSSLIAGFYYSADDQPSIHGGASWVGGYGWSEVETGEENLWRYEESGDNYCITRKICDNFYYVVAGN